MRRRIGGESFLERSEFRADPLARRFGHADLSVVLGVRFYTGVPIYAPAPAKGVGLRIIIGTLSVADDRRRRSAPPRDLLDRLFVPPSSLTRQSSLLSAATYSPAKHPRTSLTGSPNATTPTPTPSAPTSSTDLLPSPSPPPSHLSSTPHDLSSTSPHVVSTRTSRPSSTWRCNSSARLSPFPSPTSSPSTPPPPSASSHHTTSPPLQRSTYHSISKPCDRRKGDCGTVGRERAFREACCWRWGRWERRGTWSAGL